MRGPFYRIFHPRLFDDTAHRAALDRIGDKIAGRRVAIVGNAQSLFACSDGGVIDACGFVVRLNRGYIVDHDAQGGRTDAVCVSNKVPLAEIEAEFGGVDLIYGNKDRWVMSADMWRRRSIMAFYPLAAWSRLSALIGGHTPSTGLIAADLFRNVLGAGEVRLFGFDWKATKTFYAEELARHIHDWTAERGLLERWAKEGRLVLPHSGGSDGAVLVGRP